MYLNLDAVFISVFAGLFLGAFGTLGALALWLVDDRAKVVPRRAKVFLSVAMLLLGATLGGVFFFTQVEAPREVVVNQWDYPVQPFVFTRNNAPEGALHVTVTVGQWPNSATYEVYVWSGGRHILWTWRQVIAP